MARGLARPHTHHRRTRPLQHVGCDVGKESIAIAVVNDDGDLEDEFEINNDPDGFADLEDRLEADNARFALEACSYAFPLHEHLKNQGLEVNVAHPRKVRLITENESKTDMNDAHILADLLRVGYLPSAYLPTRELLRVRDIARDRREVGEEMTRWKTRLRSQLDTHGIEIPFTGQSLWTRKGIAWLKEPKFNDDRDRLLRQRVLHIESLEQRKAILEPLLAEAALGDERAHWLMSIPGCKWYLAMFILGEVATIDRFEDVDAFKKYSACCPRVSSTGGHQDPYGVVRHGNKELKWAFGQIADYLRKSIAPENPVREDYRARCAKQGHGSGMAVARREVCELVYNLLKVQEPCNWASGSVLENKLAKARVAAPSGC